MCTHDNKNRGIALSDGHKHSEDHESWTRRSFLRTLGVTGGATMAFGGLNLTALAANASLPLVLNGGVEDRILVIIRLAGGNDGLNTIIPLHDYSRYLSNRGNLAISEANYFTLDNANALPNEMNALANLWNNGHMKVAHTVGYENHNLSHFKGSEIFDTANPSFDTSVDKSGWLGKYILDKAPDFLENLPSIPAAIKINSGSSKTYFNQNQLDLAVNFNSLNTLQSIAESGIIYDTENLPDDCYYGEQIGYIRNVLNITYEYAPLINEAYEKAENLVQYQGGELANSLAIIARLIRGGLGTKLFMVTLNGFDTHENQKTYHLNLLNSLSESVASFYNDLSQDNKDGDVLTMTVSEFGRRVNANGNQGTDHGTAAPMMFFGSGLQGNGFVGDLPDLQNLDTNGNLEHSIDFRSIYATVLENWLCLDPIGVDSILGDSYERLDLGINCISSGNNDYLPIEQEISHRARPDGNGGIIIDFSLNRPANTVVEIFTMTGQKLGVAAEGYHVSGSHSAQFNNGHVGLVPIPIVYRIRSASKIMSGKFILGQN